MDFYGIGAAIQGAVNIYLQTARRSGRTTSLLGNLKDGDRVYFANQNECKHFQNQCRARKLNIECVVIPVREPNRVFERPPSQGRAIFSHDWIEQLYKQRIEQTQNHIDQLERESSGTGEAHHETRIKAETLMKWQPYQNKVM